MKKTLVHRIALVLALLLLGAVGCVDSFDLGVGAFEIGTTDAILWTHATPAEADARFLALQLEVASDPGFANIVHSRPVFARPEEDFTARAHVHGLAPSSHYYYRFSAFGAAPMSFVESRVGEFTTAPTRHDPAPLRFVLSGDSNLGYTAPRGLDFHVLSAAAAETPAPDFFVYFGDTIYADSGVLPTGDAATLDEYRAIHRLTRADPHLQNVLAAMGTYSGWDDHEVRNDYDGETVDPAQFTAGARAFFEYLPVRTHVGGAPYRVDRSARWGQDAELFFLDGRQFRSAELFCNPDPIPDGPLTPDTLFSPFELDEMLAQPLLGALYPLAAPLLTPSDEACVADILAAPGRTLLGADQLAELEAKLVASDASFKIIVNDVPLSSLLSMPYDRWEGYLAERQQLLSFIATNLDPSHVLVLTTDFHTNLAIQRGELTEVIVGPIGQTTFKTSVLSLVPPNLAPFGDLIVNLFGTIVDLANGAGSVLGNEPDAFSYALVDVYREAGVPKLRVTVRGDRNYAAGANDPANVEDLFTFTMP